MLRKFALVILAVSTLSVASLVADPRLCLAWWLARRLGLGWWLGLARWMGPRMASWMGTCMGTWMGMAFRLGMGWTTFHRGARILRRRMRRPARCPRPVGAAQDSRQ